MFSFFPFIMTVSGYNNELPLSPFNKETLRLERERVLKNTVCTLPWYLPSLLCLV